MDLHSGTNLYYLQQNKSKRAHGIVRSGADFPSYIQEIKALGFTHYEAYVTDGHIDYHGGGGYTEKVPAK
jgi:uncharacterized protein YbcV (DUF1398 family)